MFDYKCQWGYVYSFCSGYFERNEFSSSCSVNFVFVITGIMTNRFFSIPTKRISLYEREEGKFLEFVFHNVEFVFIFRNVNETSTGMCFVTSRLLHCAANLSPFYEQISHGSFRISTIPRLRE